MIGRIRSVLGEVAGEAADAEEADYFRVHSLRYERILSLVEGQAAGRSLAILDVGCYPYQLSSALERLGHTVSGISGPNSPVSGRRDVRPADIEKDRFPFDDDSFDLVVFTEVIEHLPQSPVPALREMRRVVRPRGQLLATTRNIAVLGHRFRLLRGKSIMWGIGVYLQNDGAGGDMVHRHHREYTAQELGELIASTGWELVRTGHFIGIHPRPATGIARVGVAASEGLKRVFPSLTDTVFAVAEKS